MNNEEQERFDLIKSLAEQGNADAQFCLGFAYYSGDKGVEKDKKKAAKWLKLSAEQGNELAQFGIGDLYYLGEGVEQNYDEALKWYKLSAEQGCSSGQFALGKYYYYGKSEKENYKEAMKWFKLSVEQGHRKAQGFLADCYYQEDNYTEAKNLFRPLAEQGDNNAQCRLADCYYCEQNYKEALKWITLSAEQGNEKAQRNLETLKFNHFGGTINHQGKSVTKKELNEIQKQIDYKYKNFAIIPRGYLLLNLGNKDKLIINKDFIMSIDELKQKAERGDAEAQFYLAVEYQERGDSEESLKWFILSAEQGITRAQFNAAAMILKKFDFCKTENNVLALKKGDVLIKNAVENEDLKQAFKLFYMAAENGIGRAQSKLGQMFLMGWGVELSHTEAIKWYEKANENGETEGNANLSFLYAMNKDYSESFKVARNNAMQSKSDIAYYNVGVMYLNGIGVKQDSYQAYVWLKRSAELDFALAEFAIGRMLLTGWGVKKDVDEAIKYFRKAAEKGDIEAEILLAKIEKRTQVFVSYSHKDEQYEKELREHLDSLVYSGIINYWDDEKLETGDNIDAVIEVEMSKAKVIIFLVSPSFMASHYVRSFELDRLIDAAENEGARIIWIPVRSCLIDGTRLEKYRGLIDKNEFLADKEKLSDRDKIYTKATKVIKEQVKQ